MAFKTFRDSAIFTTHRLIVRDAQGMRGKKVEVYSLPYSAINMWSTENAGTLDFNAEVELWTRAGRIKIKIGRGLDVRRIDMLIGRAVLGGGKLAPQDHSHEISHPPRRAPLGADGSAGRHRGGVRGAGCRGAGHGGPRAVSSPSTAVRDRCRGRRFAVLKRRGAPVGDRPAGNRDHG